MVSVVLYGLETSRVFVAGFMHKAWGSRVLGLVRDSQLRARICPNGGFRKEGYLILGSL